MLTALLVLFMNAPGENMNDIHYIDDELPPKPGDPPPPPPPPEF